MRRQQSKFTNFIASNLNAVCCVLCAVCKNPSLFSDILSGIINFRGTRKVVNNPFIV